MISISRLSTIFKENNKSVTLTSRYDQDKAKLIKKNIETLMPILASSGATKYDGLDRFVNWQAAYGKMSGCQIQYRCKGFGRLYPSKPCHGYVGITRSVRHFLAKDLYTDIDIDNCHPSLIEQMFPIITGSPSKALHEWNTNRDAIFKDIIELGSKCGKKLTKDDCKSIGYTFLYGGDMHYRFNKLGLPTDIAPGSIYQRCKSLCTEMETFTDRFSQLFPEMWQSIIPSKSKDSSDRINSSKLSISIQHLERHIALILKEVAEKHGLEVGDICHDGLFISKGGSPVSSESCSAYFAEAIETIKDLTGFTVALSCKPMVSPDWVGILKQDSPIETPETDLDALRVLLEIHPHWVSCCGKLYGFNHKTGIWSDEQNVHINIIHQYEKELGKYASHTKHTNALYAKLKSIDADNDWLENVSNSSLGKMAFKDGWYDFDAKTFHQEFTPEFYFPFKVPHNFPRDDVDTSYVRKILFLDPLGTAEMADFMIYKLSRALDGRPKKFANFCIGPAGNNGKTLVSLSLGYALGSYHDTFSGECLSVSKSEDEEARRLRWALLARHARIITCNEIKMGTKLSGPMVKKVTSGGDELVARVHNGLETAFIPHFTPFIFANDVDNITPHDEALDRRLHVIPYMFSFVDNPTLPSEKLIDSTLSTKAKTPEFAEALLRILIDGYDMVPPEVPQFCKQAKSDHLGEVTNPINDFLEDYDITNNPDHYVVSKDLLAWATANSLSEKKLFLMIRDHCSKNGFKNVEPGKKQHIRVWKGVKPRDGSVNMDECQLGSS